MGAFFHAKSIKGFNLQQCWHEEDIFLAKKICPSTIYPLVSNEISTQVVLFYSPIIECSKWILQNFRFTLYVQNNIRLEKNKNWIPSQFCPCPRGKCQINELHFPSTFLFFKKIKNYVKRVNMLNFFSWINFIYLFWGFR